MLIDRGLIVCHIALLEYILTCRKVYQKYSSSDMSMFSKLQEFRKELIKGTVKSGIVGVAW